MKDALNTRVRSRFDSDIYYQAVEIKTTATENEYDVILEERFKYCDGIMAVNTNEDIVWSLEDKGKYIVDKLPRHFTETLNVPSQDGRFIPINTIASGTKKRIYIKEANVGDVQTFIFRLTNKEPEHINKKYEIFKIHGPASSETEHILLFKSSVKKIKSVAVDFSIAPSTGGKITIQDDIRTYIKNYQARYLEVNELAKFSERSLPIDIGIDKLKLIYKNNFTVVREFYVIFEYEE